MSTRGQLRALLNRALDALPDPSGARELVLAAVRLLEAVEREDEATAAG